MSETKTEGESQPVEKTEAVEAAEIPPSEPKLFKIESLDDLKYVMTLARGGDPDAVQAIAKFMDLGSNAERAYFTDKRLMLCVAQQIGYGQTYFRGHEWDPFTLVADCISVATMGYKGFKSNQFMEMTRQTPNLSALQTEPIDVKKGVFQRFFGGEK